MRELLFTFDTEDFISPGAISVLKTLLEQFKKYDLAALFFITGHMAERLSAYPEVVSMLKEHEIGYHSSGHSIHPTIFEFTDIESYEEAYKISITRETSHVNPITGEIEGKGGLLAVRSIFSPKKVVAFRAPGFCWSPPHIEALRDIGIKIDFSTQVQPTVFRHKDLTFYPCPHLGDWQNKSSYYRLLLLSVFRNKITIANLHPSIFINQKEWDSIYWEKNPLQLVPPPQREDSEIATRLKSFEIFLKRVRTMQRLGILSATPNLQESFAQKTFSQEDVLKSYEMSARWPRRLFHYEPKFLKKHFYRFFNVPFPS
jgi:hypothetical protein